MPTLTAVRFFAALWVTLYHFELFGAPIPGGPIGRVVQNGHFGVAFFFVLSGFILAHTYASRVLAPRFEWKPFLLARVARVYPLYVAALVLGGIQQAIALGPGTSRALLEHPVVAIGSNLLLIQNWSPSWREALNGPGWSIACEAAFYLAFPLLAALTLRSSTRGLTFVAVGGLLFGIAMEILGTNLGSEIAASQGLQGREIGAVMAIGGRFLPFARFDEFLLGIVAYRALKEFSPRRILGGAALLTVVVVATLVAVGRLTIGRQLPTSGFFLAVPSKTESIFPILSALAIVALARAKGERPRWLAHPALVYGGKISFALYLVHLPILFLLLPLRAYGVPPTLVYILAFALALAVAAAGFGWIEEPARNLIIARSRRAKKVPEPFPAAP